MNMNCSSSTLSKWWLPTPEECASRKAMESLIERRCAVVVMVGIFGGSCAINEI
ncbi:hypothetical protein F2Q69_00014830 [Brassica cretica]|uniref:Uncharacterized protein n=1 Tax=Brassica cretica TaxID=69181 RepID=A0A8S9R6W9_BRACR|nr:hypothetical protein F2Q69_00014830 [Brassica cretica]